MAHFKRAWPRLMPFDSAEHGRKGLHYIKPGSAPCRVRLHVIYPVYTIAPVTHAPLQASQAWHPARLGARPRYVPVYTIGPGTAPTRPSTLPPFFQRLLLRHNANYVTFARIPGCPFCSVSGPSTVICLHYTSNRAEHRQCGTSPVDLGRPTSSEPGLAPIRACLHYRGRAQRQLDHQHGRPQFAPCRACAGFLKFPRYHRATVASLLRLRK